MELHKTNIYTNLNHIKVFFIHPICHSFCFTNFLCAFAVLRLIKLIFFENCSVPVITLDTNSTHFIAFIKPAVTCGSED